MGSSFTPTSVSDLIDLQVLVINDGYRAKNSELSSGGLPFARAGDINKGFHFDGADCFPVQDLAKVGIKISEPGDVVFTSKGTVGRFAFVRADTPRFVYSPQLCFWRVLNPNCIEPRWLYYWMQSREFAIQVAEVAGQTDMAEYVSLRDQRRMHITIPSLPEQRAIVGILGALDDKIELNRRTNESLESIARAIFKSWFVDFDPVRENIARKTGKARGQPPLPGLSAALEAAGAAAPEGVLDLFPDEFEDSELGPIPRGWRVSRIGDVAQIFSGKRPLSRFAESSPEASVPLWGGNGPMAFVPSSLTEFPVLLTGRVGTLGSVFRVKPPSWPSDNTLILRPHRMRDFEYLFHWLQQIDFDVLNRGSTQPLIAQSDLKSEPVLEPSEPVLSCFGDVAKAIYRRVDAAVDESTDLSAVRDALLPKLISGELRVSDTEAISREAS